MSDARYAFSLTTFSPSGKLGQIEHALAAVHKGKTCLGIQATDGVVLATEKKVPSILVDETSFSRTAMLADNIGVIYSGMGPDFRVLVRKGQKKAIEYFLTFKERIPVLQLVKEIASIMQEFTQSGGVRPFGVSLLIAGFDEEGAQLYQVDPSGSYFAWRASALGSNYVNANAFLERRYGEDMELEDAIHTALLTLREGFEGEMTAQNIEVSVVGKDRKFKTFTAAEVKDYLEEAV